MRFPCSLPWGFCVSPRRCGVLSAETMLALRGDEMFSPRRDEISLGGGGSILGR